MIRFLFRFVGFWLLAGGFVALIVDGTRSIAASTLTFTATGDAWYALAPDSLDHVEASARGASQFLWDYALAPVLNAPFFGVLMVLGVLLLLIGRVRERSRFEAA